MTPAQSIIPGLTYQAEPSYRADPSYRPDIDGLRAVAILSVVLYHGGLLRIGGGFTGVDIFFVISGYLIGGHIYAEIRDGSFSFANFYRRRARRILPAFFAVLAFVLLAGLILLSPIDLARLARSACAAAVSASNILFWHSASYFDTRSDLNPLLMTWSLGVEEQFY
ncbi:MAG: acyltransferase family protein, partial [Terracidiphilus sp.]